MKLLTPGRKERISLSRRRMLKAAAASGAVMLLGTTRKSIAGVGALGRGVGRVGPSSSNPFGFPLVTDAPSLFTYQGSFALDTHTWQYGGHGMTVIGSTSGTSLGTLYGAAIENSNTALNYGAVTLPTLAQIQGGGATATTLIAPTAIPLNIGQGPSGIKTCGALYYNGSMYLAAVDVYNSSGGQNAVFISGNTGLTSFGSPYAAGGPDVTNNGYSQPQFSGQISLLPSIWRPYFNGPAFVTAMTDITFVSSSCCGYGFSAFDPANIGSAGGSVPLQVLLNYPYSKPNNSGGPTSAGTFNGTALWNRPNVIGSISGSVLTINSIAIQGQSWGVGSWVMTASGSYTTILSLGTGTSGGTGTFNLATSPGNISAGSVPNIYVGNNAQTPCAGGQIGGDDLASMYDGPLGCAVIPTGTRSLLHIVVHSLCYDWGAPEQRWTGTVTCTQGQTGFSVTTSTGTLGTGYGIYDSSNNFVGYVQNVSGSSGTFAAGASETLSGASAIGGLCPLACSVHSGASGYCGPFKVMIVGYDLKEIYDNYQSNGAASTYVVTPYTIWDFPNWQSLWGSCVGGPKNGCSSGWMAYDPVNQLLYGNALGFAGNAVCDVFSFAGN